MLRESILVVDDNPEILLLIQLLLVGENFTVRTANSALEALEALSASVPDVMLTDIQMPNIDGLELIRRVRLNPWTQGIFILAVTANAMKESIQEAYAAGCDGYITKPLDTRTFAAWVRAELKLGRTRETARPTAAAASAEAGLSYGECLLDCRRQIGQLLASSKESLRREQACDILHRCAGTAGVLGYPQIAALARSLETDSAALEEPGFSSGLNRLADLLEHVHLQAATRAG
jgi:CheY-like chemotaxis protein